MPPLDPDDPIVRMATLGRIVEDFMAGPIGVHLQERASQEEYEALEKLKTVDPEDPALIRKYQNKALIAGKVMEWIQDAIHQGQMCLDKLKEDIDGN